MCGGIRGDMRADVTVGQVLDPKVIERVLDLVNAAAAADEVPPVSDYALLHVKHGAPATAYHLILPASGNGIAGYAHVDLANPAQGPVAELVVHPQHRRRGAAKALASCLITLAQDERLRLWAHGDHPAAAAFAAKVGFRNQRTLWQMRRSLSDPLPPYVLPAGIAVSTFRPGIHGEQWIALNAKAFADHPEQGQLTLADLHQLMREPWFDPNGFFLAWRREQLVGFHWTKVHPPFDEHAAIGEVYVLGVAPQEQGKGLGRALTVIGLEYLRARGLDHVMLYVDSDNEPAIRTYTSLGFAKFKADVLYGR